MAMQDKVLLMNKIEGTLKPRMFANLLEEAVDEIGNHLNSFDIHYEAENNLQADNLLESFIQAKRVEGRSEKTLLRYQYMLQRFLASCGVRPSEVNTAHIRDYFSHEKQRGIADSSIEGTRQILNAFFGWLDKERLIKANPMNNVGRVKCQKKIKEAFSETDLEKLNRACKSIRDQAIIHFLMATGCRISEVCGLNRQDIDLNSGECIVLGKGNKERIVYLDEVTCMILREYIATRTDRMNELFLSKKMNRISPGTVRYILHNLSEQAGVANVHPHRFRRTLITVLLNRGMALQEVAVLAGHDSVDTTIRYFAVNKDHVKNSYKRFSY